jgi:tetratricopeptide (TPR) repeat protein
MAMNRIMSSNAVAAHQYLQAGAALLQQNQFAAAIGCFDSTLQLDPDNRYARWNRATALLSLGDYRSGFVEHDVAWQLFHWRGFGPVQNDIDRIVHLPLWQGEAGARVLAYHELGFGDAIMAFRFLPALTARCDVTLVIDPCLARLAGAFDADIATSVPGDLGEFDFRLPFFGVMAALGITEHTIPRQPYLPATWSREGGKIGIAWSGRTQTDFTLERFLSLLAPDKATRLCALQPGPVAWGVEPLAPGSDFADVRDRIAAMDHIVSVDTAAIHLAGAMGHPSAHLVLPFFSDWRWWHVERWYPTLKTYRQDMPPEWSRPFARLKAALR